MSIENIKLSDYPFHHKTKTRWKDLDAFQHINNAVFLSYFEDARIALFDRWNLKPNGKSLIVASVKVNYYKQLLHPSDFSIGQKVSRVGNSSFDIQSTMFNDNEEVISDALITCVCFDFNNQSTQPVYDLIKNDYNK
tara:strand:- start:232 stop:642 length:411 start_codon:yes stop_codon:yes gene_type:complete